MCLLLNGCNDNTEVFTTTSLEKEVYVTLENSNITFPLNFGVGINRIEFEIVSGFEIQDEQIVIPELKGHKYSVSISEIEVPTIPKQVYLEYKNVDWKKMYTLENGGDETFEEYTKYSSEMEEGYESDEHLVSNSFYYSVLVDFDSIVENDEFHEIHIERDKKETLIYDVGEINFTNINLKNQLSVGDRGIVITTLASEGRSISPNQIGYLGSESISFESNTDAELIEVNVLNKNMSVDKVVVTSSSENSSVNKIMKDEPIQISSGSVGEINVSLIDENFAGKLDYSTFILLELKFRDTNGNVTIESFSSLVRTNRDINEVIAHERDALDFTSYYLDYVK